MDTDDWVGGVWLAARYTVELVLPLAVQSRIAGRRTSRLVDGIRTETFVPAMRPGNDLRGHLTFHLKHEVLHLELLSRVFERIAQPTSVRGLRTSPVANMLGVPVSCSNG